jgi:hypothetical protein
MTTETDLAAMVERLAVESELCYVDERLDNALLCRWTEDVDLRPHLKRLAALVAGECARLVLDEHVGGGTDDPDVVAEDQAYNTALHHAAAAIRERFGIEEG